MRVIAGEYRRRTLEAPRGMATRPTTDRLRETLFNVLAPRIEGARFLDLYAGSGANGMEALSRGAAHSVFVEKAAPALAAIRANLSQLRIDPARYAVEAQPVTTWLRRAAASPGSAQARPRTLTQAPPGDQFDVIFLDPPYDEARAYSETLLLLGGEASGLLSKGAFVIAEHRRGRRPEDPSALADQYGRLTRDRLLTQGDAALSFYSLRAEAASEPEG